MRVVLFVCLAAVAAAKMGEWSCSRKQIQRKRGNICCNDAVGKMMKGKMKRGPSKKAAVAIRKALEKEEGGYWESVVAKSDFGFANYMVGSFHCKVSAISCIHTYDSLFVCLFNEPLLRQVDQTVHRLAASQNPGGSTLKVD